MDIFVPNPSSEWTDKDRLDVIVYLNTHILRGLDVDSRAITLKIDFVARKPKEELERSRSTIMKVQE